MKFRWFSVRQVLVLAGLGLSLTPEGAFAQRPLGIDVSNHQGPGINWTSVRNSGVTFAWAKATEGLSFNDGDFLINATNAKSAGLYFGAYHFAHPTNSPTAEAAHFWSIASPYIKGEGLSLMPMLDMEIFSGVSGASSYSDWANQWCNYVVSHAAAAGVTVTPVIYVSSCNACNFDASVSQWIAWLANYNGLNPQSGNPWNVCSGCAVWGPGVWNVWQYSSTAVVPGVSGNCDVDVLNGTAASLVSTLVIPPSPAIEPPSLTVNEGARASFAAYATNAGPLRYQWMFNGTNIPGATATNYTILNSQISNAGAYSVVVSNPGGGVFSSPAFLSVVAPLSNAPGSVLAPPGLVNWWPADGNPNDIVSANNATPHAGFYYVAGKQGRAFHFDGASGYLTTGRPSLSAPWTVCMWVNRQNAPGAGAALMGDGIYELKLEQFNGTRQVGFTQFGVGDYTFGYVVPANVWTHLALVGTPTNTSLYVNGVWRSTLSNTLPAPRAYLGVGYVNSTARLVDYLLGNLDEILLFNRALAPSEINSIYAAGSAGLMRAPEFTGTPAWGNGQFQVNLRGLTGKNFTLYSSPDLVTWTSLGPLANPNGMVQFIDNSASDPVRFYRATQP